MFRHKNIEWILPEKPTYEQAQLGVLMDIRDELKEINNSLRVLRCPSFIAVPRILRRISANTYKPKRKET